MEKTCILTDFNRAHVSYIRGAYFDIQARQLPNLSYQNRICLKSNMAAINPNCTSDNADWEQGDKRL